MGGDRFAKKSILDVLKMSGGSPRKSWGPEQCFSSTPGRTLWVTWRKWPGMKSSLWLLWAQEPRGKGTVTGLVGAANMYSSAPLEMQVADPNLSCQDRFCTHCWLCLLCLPPSPSSLGRAGPSVLFAPGFLFWFYLMVAPVPSGSDRDCGSYISCQLPISAFDSQSPFSPQALQLHLFLFPPPMCGQTP